MSHVWTLICRRHCLSLPRSPLATSRYVYQSPLRASWHLEENRAFHNRDRSQFPARKPSRKQNSVLRTDVNRPPAASKLKARKQVKPPSIKASPEDIQTIFGAEIAPEVGNVVIRELQQRRVSGLLADLGLDVAKLAPDITQEQATQALEWLRDKYPVDEALAAEQYAEAVDAQYRAEAEAKAINSWMYQKEEKRKANAEAQLPMEQWSKERKAMWREQTAKAEALEKQYAEEQAEVRLAVVNQQIELAQRRDDKLAKWDELEKKAELDTAELTDKKRTVWSRLGRPLIFGSISLVTLSLLLDPSSVSEPQQGLAIKAWSAPDTMQLMTPSVVTCGAITAVNLVLLIAWRNPALWYSMNRLFLLSAGNPNTFSVLGSVFSHQRWIMHLAANSTLLFALGMPLHDEIGRANFLAIYLGSGICASCSSLAFHVLRRNFLMASLGASGAVMGLYGAFFTVSSRRDLYIPYVDKHITYDSWIAIAAFLVLEAGMFWRTKGLTYDHVNHLAGLAAGSAFGLVLRPKPKPTTTEKTHDTRDAGEQMTVTTLKES